MPADDEPSADTSGVARVLSPADNAEARRDAMRGAERGRRRAAAPPPVAGISEPARCPYAAMLCRGCQQEIGLDVWMIPGGLGMVHNVSGCYDNACTLRDAAAAREEEGEAARRRRAEGPGGAGEPAAAASAAMDVNKKAAFFWAVHVAFLMRNDALCQDRLRTGVRNMLLKRLLKRFFSAGHRCNTAAAGCLSAALPTCSGGF